MSGSEEIKRDLLEAVSQRELQIIGLVDIYGFEYREVGRILGISHGLAFILRTRALEKIVKIYSHYEFKQTVAKTEVNRRVRLGVNNTSREEREQCRKRRVSRETNNAQITGRAAPGEDDS